ncbi:MAG: hypothetical protein AVDCRST_MAG43-807 [uncultured Thermomicrobiales bacterium]|uniref:Uncharacterized protein n=1 Tax=uncultured Thermomicrobiales bacterium TaxID=1645740 RepID=A0A6J4UDP9_9BACT|nr:MAG: hypothetical protein AVDCRST_MAG43-807 [uncultured Thermomicrobiales bacterium]
MTNGSDSFDTGRAITWSDHDLTDALVFMRRIPTPYVDELYGIKNREGFAAYMKTFEDDVTEILGPILAGKDSLEIKSNLYQVPPDSGPYIDFVVTLAGDVDTIVQTVDAYISMGDLLIQFFRTRKARDEAVDEGADPWGRAYMYSGIRTLESMCLYHAHSSYYDPKRHPALRVESFSRGVHVGAVDHPAPGVQYTINVRIGVESYVYVTRADGHVIDHFKINDGKVTGLPRPDFLGDDSDLPSDEARGVPPLLQPDDSSA